MTSPAAAGRDVHARVGQFHFPQRSYGRISQAGSTATARSARQLNILLVEDQRAFALLTEKLLQKIGHTVTVASSIAEACQSWRDDRFDLIISDFGLPDGDGCELLSHIERQRNVPAIALTGFGMEEDIQRQSTLVTRFT